MLIRQQLQQERDDARHQLVMRTYLVRDYARLYDQALHVIDQLVMEIERLRPPEICPSCDGIGEHPCGDSDCRCELGSHLITCPECLGSGKGMYPRG